MMSPVSIANVATALTVYGIETSMNNVTFWLYWCVATALTLYGIETNKFLLELTILKLQQHLPFTVLKLEETDVAPAAQVGCNSTYRLRY